MLIAIPAPNPAAIFVKEPKMSLILGVPLGPEVSTSKGMLSSNEPNSSVRSGNLGGSISGNGISISSGGVAVFASGGLSKLASTSSTPSGLG